MTPEQTTRTSKFLSLVLRHNPAAANVQLDEAGWIGVEELLLGCTKAGRCLNLEDLRFIVETNAKKRFEFSADGTRIRASQGHSIEVDLQYETRIPPTILYHGTMRKPWSPFEKQACKRWHGITCIFPPTFKQPWRWVPARATPSSSPLQHYACINSATPFTRPPMASGW